MDTAAPVNSAPESAGGAPRDAGTRRPRDRHSAADGSDGPRRGPGHLIPRLVPRLVPRLSRNRVAVAALTALAAAGYLAFELNHFVKFSDGSDLVYFDQAVRSYSHFQPGVSDIYGIFFGFGKGMPILGEHISPILIVLAPLYWIYDGPQSLLFAQAVLYALAIPPLWVFTRRALGGGRYATYGAYAAGVIYAVSWPVVYAVSFNFHETAFAPVLMAVIFERLQAGRLRGALLALGALLLVKEDMGLFAAGVGMYLAAVRRPLVPRQRLVAAGLMVAGVGYTWFATRMLIPAFGGWTNKFWAYPTFGNSVPQAALHVIEHPLSSLQVLFTPAVKVSTELWLFGAFCFLSLLSPITLAALPLLIERMIATSHSSWWVTGFHYNAYLVVPLLCAAVEGAVRLEGWSRSLLRWAGAKGRWSADSLATGSVALACACVMGVVGYVLIAQLPIIGFLKPGFYHISNQGLRAEAAAVAAIPPGVTVESIPSASPSLSARDNVWFLRGTVPPRGAPWVLIEVDTPYFTFPTTQTLQDRVTLLRHDGYRIVYSSHGFIVLHRVAG